MTMVVLPIGQEVRCILFVEMCVCVWGGGGGGAKE